MNAFDVIPWVNYPRGIPVICQDKGTLEVMHVTQHKKAELVRLWKQWRTCRSEFFLDCDADCVLMQTEACDVDVAECKQFHRPLGDSIPQGLFDGTELILAVAQDALQGDILMAAYMGPTSLELTLSTRLVHYFSRKRQEIWKKGQESGHMQDYWGATYDPKARSVILRVQQRFGAACHEGYRSCFFRQITSDGSLLVRGYPLFDPAKVYKKS